MRKIILLRFLQKDTIHKPLTKQEILDSLSLENAIIIPNSNYGLIEVDRLWLEVYGILEELRKIDDLYLMLRIHLLKLREKLILKEKYI